MESFRFLVVLVTILCVALSAWPIVGQQACPRSLTSLNGTVKSFSNCTDLKNQGSTLSWSFVTTNGSVDSGGDFEMAFRTTLTGAGGWAAWGINLVSPAVMEGTNALIAFNAANGTNVLPYKLTLALKGSNPPPLACSPIDMEVISSQADIDSTTLAATIYATIRLPPNLTVLNQVWNRGPSVTKFQPAAHILSPETLTSYGSLDIRSGAVTAGPSEEKKDNHGIVSTISWGILLPLGIMVTRYIRP